MFCIPCKYSNMSNSIINLVMSIRQYHPNEKITIVDSDSLDKSYFDIVEKYDVKILDIKNKNWMIGAYWKSYFEYPNEDYYYFIHDSTIVKGDMLKYKQNELVLLATFNKNSGDFNGLNSEIREKTKYKNIRDDGFGCYGPMFFCNNKVITNMYNNDFHLILPNNKQETGWMEGAFGAVFEHDGYNLMNCSLFGDILEKESPGGKSYPPPFNTSWQYPIEKFYNSHRDVGRL